MSGYDTVEFRNMLAFLVLMSGNNILSKSPDYIWEKYIRYVVAPELDHVKKNINYDWGLDDKNRRIFERYIETWL
jgi:hypothetical protein